jgi:hypothetical protein
LWGYHSIRTPFAYPEYKRILQENFRYIEEAERADAIIAGYTNTFFEQKERLAEVLAVNPNVKLIVVSEEPVWDTLWCSDYFEHPKVNIDLSNKLEVTVYHLNHETSDIFSFDRIPYFLTTENKYIDRYLQLYRKILRIGAKKLEQQWHSNKTQYTFIAEYRREDKYRYENKERDLLGLSVYRTLLAQGFRGAGTYIEGKKWFSDSMRQSLPDWHLDKLAKTFMSTTYLSAIENTHQKNYISEKLFDAYAVGAIPIYFASKQHRIHEICNANSFVNMSGKAPEKQDLPEIKGADYMAQVSQLIDRFTLQNVFAERQRVVESVSRSMHEIFNDTFEK